MPLAIQVLLAVLVITAAFYDLRWRRIPNWLALAGVIAGVALNSFLFEWSGLRASLEGLGLAALLYFPMYLLRAMGAGDVKLMMAIGTMVGWKAWLAIFVFTGIVGGVFAIAVLLWHKRAKKTIWNVGFLLHRILHFRAPYIENEELDVRKDKGVRLPHALPIAVGAIGFLVLGRLHS